MMLARAAENIYWMSRYLERAENTARLINAASQVLLDLPRGASFGWDVLIKVVGLDREFHAAYAEANEENILRFLVSDAGNAGSIFSCIARARENSRNLREVLPAQAWERINSLYLFVLGELGGIPGATQRYRLLEEVIARSQALIGLLSDCMSHDIAYQFLALGRYIERTDMTTRIVDINAAVLMPRHQVPEDPSLGLLWTGVLTSLHANQMYRRHVSVHTRSGEVLDFLLRDPHFPRTVAYCLNKIESTLVQLPHHAAPLKVMRTAQRRVDAMRLDNLSPALRHEYLDAIQTDLVQLHDSVTREYFRPRETAPAPRHAVAA